MARTELANSLQSTNSEESVTEQKMGPKLKYVITIPSVDIPGYIAINDLLLIGSKDERYKKIKSENKVLTKYLNSFRTSFNRKVYPSIIVRDENLPKVDAVHLSSFRNAIAVSCVIYSRVQSYLSDTQRGFYCTDLFDFCPVSVSSDGTDLSVRTAHEIGAWAPVEKFRGQLTTAVVHPEHIHPLFDDEFMLCLCNLIERKFNRASERKFKNRVNRSLEMAYHALRSPCVNLQSKTDFGVAVSLWVSAFETLAHPGNRDVNLSDVNSLIKAVPWQDRRLLCSTRAHISKYFGRNKAKKRTTLPVQIYGRLYNTRHMYLHGNPIPEGQYEFVRRKSWGNLYFQIPTLYRCVLLDLLLRRGVTLPAGVHSEQRTYERALLKRPKVGESIPNSE